MSEQLESTEPPLKRIRAAVEDGDDVEMTDVSGREVLTSPAEPQVDRKGKGRARDPVDDDSSMDAPADVAVESETESQNMDSVTGRYFLSIYTTQLSRIADDIDLTAFMDQDVMFPAALEEQLSVSCISSVNRDAAIYNRYL